MISFLRFNLGCRLAIRGPGFPARQVQYFLRHADGVFGDRFLSFSGAGRSSVAAARTCILFASISYRDKKTQPRRLDAMTRAVAAIQWSLKNAYGGKWGRLPIYPFFQSTKK
jgi:hypothetical protein